MNAQVAMIFAEKTVPSSLMVSMLAWALMNPRASAGSRVITTNLLSNFLTLCQSTNEFKAFVYPPGSLN